MHALSQYLAFLLLSVLAIRPAYTSVVSVQSVNRCTVPASGSNATDDAPAIVEAFKRCGRGGVVEFLNETYYVNSVMNITWLKDCEIDLKGTLLVSSTSSI